MHKRFIQVGTILGALAVGLGAFGAHGLKELLPAESLTAFETGVRYHFYHVFAILICGILYTSYPLKWIRIAAYLFMIGILLFSGSLYAITALKVANAEGLGWIGPITPLGGLSFIAGWICLFFAVPSMKSTKAV